MADDLTVDERIDGVIEILESAIENLRDPVLRSDAGDIWMQAWNLHVEAQILVKVARQVEPGYNPG